MTAALQRLWRETPVEWNQRLAGNRDYASRRFAWLLTAIGRVTYGRKPGCASWRGWVWQMPGWNIKGADMHRRKA